MGQTTHVYAKYIWELLRFKPQQEWVSLLQIISNIMVYKDKNNWCLEQNYGNNALIVNQSRGI